jgi:hypothetical protein
MQVSFGVRRFIAALPLAFRGGFQNKKTKAVMNHRTPKS